MSLKRDPEFWAEAAAIAKQNAKDAHLAKHKAKRHTFKSLLQRFFRSDIGRVLGGMLRLVILAQTIYATGTGTYHYFLSVSKGSKVFALICSAIAAVIVFEWFLGNMEEKKARKAAAESQKLADFYLQKCREYELEISELSERLECLERKE